MPGWEKRVTSGLYSKGEQCLFADLTHLPTSLCGANSSHYLFPLPTLFCIAVFPFESLAETLIVDSIEIFIFSVRRCTVYFILLLLENAMNLGFWVCVSCLPLTQFSLNLDPQEICHLRTSIHLCPLRDFGRSFAQVKADLPRCQIYFSFSFSLRGLRSIKKFSFA